MSVCEQFRRLDIGSVNPPHYQIISVEQHDLNRHCTSKCYVLRINSKLDAIVYINYLFFFIIFIS